MDSETLKIPEKFQLKICQFLSRGYWDIAENISKKTGYNFILNWASESEEIEKKLNYSTNVQEMGIFHGYGHEAQLSGMSTDMSEIYRSAYLRVLEKCFKSGNISEKTSLNLAYMTLPIDLSLWNVNSGRAPQWWPKFDEKDWVNENNIDDVNNRIFLKIENCVKEKNGTVLLAINGAIKSPTGWSGKLTSSIKIIGFAFLKDDANDFSNPIIAEFILNTPCLNITSSTEKPFRFLDSYKEYIDYPTPFFIFNGITGFHLICHMRIEPVCLWQWYRFYYGLPLGLSSELTQNVSIKNKEGKWRYYQGDSQIAECHDWLEGLHERVQKNEIIPYGRFIEVSSQFLSDYLEGNGCNLGYAIEITHNIRKYSHEEPKIVKTYKILVI